MRKSRNTIRLAITSGDVDGIGAEVALKALLKLPKSSGVQFHLYLPKNIHKSLRSNLKKLDSKGRRNNIEFIFRDDHPALWVEDAAKKCLSEDYHGLVTGPLSKTGIVSAGLKDMGHTDILKRISSTSEVFMGFLGSQFNVVLASAHLPLSQVSNYLNQERLISCLRITERFKTLLPIKTRKLPLALLGVNPHAGESGLLGSEENEVLSPIVKQLNGEGCKILGPLSPDAAFQTSNWKKFSLFVCSYHDQGLIPFKMIHGQDDGAQVSIGLPFVRTSVDHGTAKDLFGKNKANYKSMSSAIGWAHYFARRKYHGV